MKILLLKKYRILEHVLQEPMTGNYWITDTDKNGEERNLINVENINNEYYMRSTFETKIIENEKEIDCIKIELYKFYKIVVDDKEQIEIYCTPTIEETYKFYKVLADNIYIGSFGSSAIKCKDLPSHQAILKYEENKWTFEDVGHENNIYINGFKETKKVLKHGDYIFIKGLKIIVLKGIFMINQLENITINSAFFSEIKLLPREALEVVEEKEEELYDKKDYFYRSPRFRSLIERKEIKIDEPPNKTEQKETSMLMSIGPTLTMGLTSLITATATLTNVYINGSSWIQAMPTLAMAITSFSIMVIWPIVGRKYEKKQIKINEERRQEKYSQYLKTKKAEIDKTIKEQTNILKENFIDLNECQNIILNQKTNLWERGIDQEDFLMIRLGIGTIPLEADIKYPEEKFVMNEDNLKTMILDIVNQRKALENVPVTLSLVEKYITAIICSGENKEKFLNGVILQLLAFHNYDFLKIVIMTNAEKEKNWEKFRNMPYCFNNDKNERYYATNLNEAREISLNLERDFQERQAQDKKTYKDFKPYYLIITDDYETVRNVDIIKDILNQDKNIGFGLIMISNTISGLPSECQNFISIGSKSSGMFESEISSQNQKEFQADFYQGNIEECISKISNLPIELETKEGMLPETLPFLDMYNVGKIEQLNVLTRWKLNNPVLSIAAPVGVDKNGSIIRIDLHEKYHGPHGLVAGMTGSGKSEFIVTYILSLAINFSPLDVSFILIDYKGGGLARIFEDKENGKKLPHVAGTITNLETSEISRALVSIESELKRRQRLFNKAREETGESTIDIYKYQKLYKQGVIKEPISHLFIISDEFAELKTDQPEFMDKLISTARIGRSLGVHLILATQKPAGIVNDQIWSNSRFRVCLKVQDKTDSQDMIKRPDAATLKNVGRFYFQVGYNELFVLGQSGYTGVPYVPTEKTNKKVDKSINFINNVGNIIESIETKANTEQNNGEQLTNVIDYIIDVAQKENLVAKKLWLEKLSSEIYINDLMEKYKYETKPYYINPIIGEYDDPKNQTHGLVTFPLIQNGNTLIYGSANSGKELLLSTLILGCAKSYSTNEINMYIADFGSETLTKYKKLPQVGDIVLMPDEEKLVNLFKIIYEEIEKRKKLFADFNGSYEYYIENSGEKLPAILFIINEYESFAETYENLSEKLSVIARDCSKYGIYIIATLSSTTSMRLKMKQNFNKSIVLKMTTNDDYAYILGQNPKISIPQIEGRGIIGLDNLYEFQTAKVYKDEELNDKLEELVKYLKENNNSINEIKILPEKVTYELLIDEKITLESIPLGINKDTLEIEKYDFKKQMVNIISSSYINDLKYFINGMVKLLQQGKNLSLYVIDAENLLRDFEKKYNYYNDDFDELFDKIIEMTNKMVDEYNENGEDVKALNKYKDFVFIIIGFDKFNEKLSENNKKKFNDFMEICKALEKYYFIMVDNIDNIRKQGYNDWYKIAIASSQYIWYGSGLNEQYTLKTSQKVKKVLDEGHGYIVRGNKIDEIKLIEEKGDIGNE